MERLLRPHQFGRAKAQPFHQDSLSDFEILDQDGKAFGLRGRTKIGLCRCGYSETKPFCDGSHKKMNFQSVIQAHDLPEPAPPVPPPAKS